MRKIDEWFQHLIICFTCSLITYTNLTLLNNRTTTNNKRYAKGVDVGYIKFTYKITITVIDLHPPPGLYVIAFLVYYWNIIALQLPKILPTVFFEKSYACSDTIIPWKVNKTLSLTVFQSNLNNIKISKYHLSFTLWGHCYY